MAGQRFPDGRLVYLHCSSIFSGANAQVRRAKKVSQLLEKHKRSIKILTKEFTLPAIAAIVKELLEEQVFESLPRARLRYPELFQLSETRGAEREASEAEILKIEAEAAQDIMLTSDDECLDFGKGAEHEEDFKLGTEVRQIVPTIVTEMQQLTPQAHQALPIPRLHPVYLPFKTQHEILTVVQSLLEECCFEFGNTWVPDLMEARKWHEVESVELTQWTQRVMKFTNSLPPTAIKPISGKTIAEVLSGTNTLRHSAVHRHPTSGVGIVEMLSAAVTLADTLNDSTRAEKIAEIKVQLEASLKEIVQHQNLLERKLTDQLREIARQRAELDALERSSIEDMLAVDKQQRASVAASIESVLVGARQTSNPCICTHGLGFAGPKAESEADENIESSRIDRKQKTLDVPSKAQGHNQSYNLGTSKLTLPKLWSEGEKKDENEAAACGLDVSAAEEEPCKMADEPRPIEETYCVIPERSFPEEECSVTAPEPGVLLEDVYPGEEAPLEEDVPFPEESVSTDIPLEVENNVPWTMQGASQAEPVTNGFNNVEEQNLKQDENIPKALDDPPQPTPEPDTAPMDCTSGNDAESPVSPPLAATTQEAGLHPPSPPASSITIPPVLEAAASEAQTIVDNHNIMLKIRTSKKIHRCVVSIRAYTRTAVLDEARAYCMQNAPQNRHFRTLQKEEGDLALESLDMDKISTDISAYEGEDLSSLIRAVGTSGIPAFTLRVKSLKT